jgi:hypothetical protein
MEKKELPEKAAARLKWITAQHDAGSGQISQIHTKRESGKLEIEELERHKEAVQRYSYGQAAREQNKEIELDDAEIAKIKQRLDGLNADYAAVGERRRHFVALKERLEAFLRERNFLLPGESNPRPTFGWTEHTATVEFPSTNPEQARQQRLAARGWRE